MSGESGCGWEGLVSCFLWEGGLMMDIVLVYCESMRGCKDWTFFLLTKTDKKNGWGHLTVFYFSNVRIFSISGLFLMCLAILLFGSIFKILFNCDLIS